MQHRLSLVRTSAWSLVVALLPLGVACNKSDDSTNNSPPVATSLTINAGSSGQTGLVGTALAQPISVRVKDGNGNAFAGATVTWTVGANNGTTSAATSTSNASGDASVVWTLGATAKPDTLTASLANGATATITSLAVISATPNVLTLLSGNNQTVTAGTETQPLVVKVTNAAGDPISGATIAWTTDYGTLTAATTTTDASGQASVMLMTSGTPITATVTAMLSATALVTFTIIGT